MTVTDANAATDDAYPESINNTHHSPNSGTAPDATAATS